MEWTALENQIMQNRCKLLEMCFQDSLKKPCRMLTSFAVLSPSFTTTTTYTTRTTTTTNATMTASNVDMVMKE
jgi:hypothetical protein